MVEESVLLWYQFPRTQTRYKMKVQQTAVQKEDNLFLAINGITDKEEKGFITELHEKEYSSSDRYVRLEVIFEMNKDLLQIERSVYNIFMLLGDIGGLNGLFVTAATTLLGIVNF